MARVTVEDCVVRVPNRFELVMVAAQRARDVSAGARLTVDRDNDKNPVVALREIADGTVNVETLHNAVISGLQRHVEVDEPEEDDMEALADRDLLMDAGDAMSDEEINEDGLSIHEDGAEIDDADLAADLGSDED